MTAACDAPCVNNRAASNRRASNAAMRRRPRWGVVMPQHRIVRHEIHHFISRDSLVMRSPFIFAHRKTVVALALKHRLPTISELPHVAREGGLMSYGFDGRETGRLLAETINKILRGAKAAEIPIQQ